MQRFSPPVLCALLLFTTETMASEWCLDQYAHLRTNPAAEPKAPRMADVKAGLVKTDSRGRPLPVLVEPREPRPKPLLGLPVPFVALVVKFKDDSGATVRNGTLELPEGPDAQALRAIMEKYPEFTFTGSGLNYEWANAIRFCDFFNSGQDNGDLNVMFRARLSPAQRDATMRLARELMRLPTVEWAYGEGQPNLP